MEKRRVPRHQEENQKIEGIIIHTWIREWGIALSLCISIYQVLFTATKPPFNSPQRGEKNLLFCEFFRPLWGRCRPCSAEAATRRRRKRRRGINPETELAEQDSTLQYTFHLSPQLLPHYFGNIFPEYIEFEINNCSFFDLVKVSHLPCERDYCDLK